VNTVDGVKYIEMVISPDDDGTARHEWGHEKDVRTNWSQFIANTTGRTGIQEMEKPHNDRAHEQRADGHKKQWDQQHKLMLDPAKSYKIIKAISIPFIVI
jgi:hypothetical protein